MEKFLVPLSTTKQAIDLAYKLASSVSNYCLVKDAYIESVDSTGELLRLLDSKASILLTVINEVVIFQNSHLRGSQLLITDHARNELLPELKKFLTDYKDRNTADELMPPTQVMSGRTSVNQGTETGISWADQQAESQGWDEMFGIKR